MENIPVLSNRLDESNGIVENVLEVKTTTKKAPWFLRFAPKAKGLVSFVQNLLSPLTRKEGVRGGQFSAFFQSAAAIAVGIGLLVGSPAEVHAACDPPVFDVCTHAFSGSWSSDGFFAVDIQFKGQSGKRYEVVWNGLKKLLDEVGGQLVWVLTYDTESDFPYSGGSEVTLTYEEFWWNQDSYGNYGCSIYEGDYGEDGGWVRGDWVAQVDFYAYQEAAYVHIDGSSSGLDFELSTYYCTIDWEPVPSPLKFGYTLGCWEYVGNAPVWPKYNGWRYHGDHGSPRFDYEGSCSYEFWPSPSFGWRCSWDTSTVSSASSGTSD